MMMHARSEEHTSELQSHFHILFLLLFLFFFNDTATTEIYSLSLHDALPISMQLAQIRGDLKIIILVDFFSNDDACIQSMQGLILAAKFRCECCATSLWVVLRFRYDQAISIKNIFFR